MCQNLVLFLKSITGRVIVVKLPKIRPALGMPCVCIYSHWPEKYVLRVGIVNPARFKR